MPGPLSSLQRLPCVCLPRPSVCGWRLLPPRLALECCYGNGNALSTPFSAGPGDRHENEAITRAKHVCRPRPVLDHRETLLKSPGLTHPLLQPHCPSSSPRGGEDRTKRTRFTSSSTCQICHLVSRVRAVVSLQVALFSFQLQQTSPAPCLGGGSLSKTTTLLLPLSLFPQQHTITTNPPPLLSSSPSLILPPRTRRSSACLYYPSHRFPPPSRLSCHPNLAFLSLY
jgi:hypothetical protein